MTYIVDKVGGLAVSHQRLYSSAGMKQQDKIHFSELSNCKVLSKYILAVKQTISDSSTKLLPIYSHYLIDPGLSS